MNRNSASCAVLTLCTLLCWHTAAQEEEPVTAELQFLDANPQALPMPAEQSPVQSLYFTPETTEGVDPLNYARGWFQQIYPGIDLVTYGDDTHLEYIFLLSAGADPSLIRLLLQGNKAVNITESGEVLLMLDKGAIVQKPPEAFVESNGRRRPTGARYLMGGDRSITIDMPEQLDEPFEKLNRSRVNVIPGGNQPGGPSYDFYLSKFEVTNDQFIRFLNDTQANPIGPRGEYMYFDDEGNVWFNSAEKKNRDEMFTISESHIVYDPRRSIGLRYSHQREANGATPFMEHPVVGVSWYGAAKYCNWLTIRSGRGTAERCFTEGTNALDWAPVTATNWPGGRFDDPERTLWLGVNGFRLPMVNPHNGTIATNEFNEFYKTAAWHGNTNLLFAYGANEYELAANTREIASLRPANTLPVGYFNGINRLGKRETTRDNNFYGVLDLNGNAEEWSADPPAPNLLSQRIRYGGSWNQDLVPVNHVHAEVGNATDSSGGFRIVTTHLPSEKVEIHMLYTFFTEPAPAAKKAPPKPARKEEELAPEELKMQVDVEAGAEEQPEFILVRQHRITEEYRRRRRRRRRPPPVSPGEHGYKYTEEYEYEYGYGYGYGYGYSAAK